MDSTSRRRRVSPRALVGKILFFNGAIFAGFSVLLGAYTLYAQQGASTTHGNTAGAVTGLLALIFAGVGLLEALAGLALWLFPGGESPPTRVVNHYYAALEHQDYATAYKAFDLSMGAFWGQRVTQAEFIKRAQMYDAEHGTVARYALAGVRANPGKRVYTIRVTRGSGSYRARLQLARQGPDWKIVGFDRF